MFAFIFEFLTPAFNVDSITFVFTAPATPATLAPWDSTKHLIVVGPYKITRNPMITGILIILTGEALTFNSVNIAYWAILFFIINCIYFKLYEEKNLEEKFGAEYIEYKKNTPAWFPKIR